MLRLVSSSGPTAPQRPAEPPRSNIADTMEVLAEAVAFSVERMERALKVMETARMHVTGREPDIVLDDLHNQSLQGRVKALEALVGRLEHAVGDFGH